MLFFVEKVLKNTVVGALNERAASLQIMKGSTVVGWEEGKIIRGGTRGG